jgi:hypothetical protein
MTSRAIRALSFNGRLSTFSSSPLVDRVAMVGSVAPERGSALVWTHSVTRGRYAFPAARVATSAARNPPKPHIHMMARPLLMPGPP